MTLTLKAIHATSRNWKSAYTVYDGEQLVGEIWQRFDRSFSGGWIARVTGGSTRSRIMTRKEAVEWITEELAS
jgi:hypothetical protein